MKVPYIGSIAASSLILGLGLLAGRVLGYARELVIASKFGLSATADSVILCLQTPELIAGLLGGLPLSSLLLPILIESSEPKRQLRTALWGCCIIGLFLHIAVTVLLAVVIEDASVTTIAVGVSLVALYPNAYTAVATTFAQSRNSFKRMGMSGGVFNAAFIIGILCFPELSAVAVIVIAAAVVRSLFLAPELGEARRNILDFLQVNLGELREFSKSYVFLLISLGVIQLSPLLDRILLSTRADGSLALFSYADKLAALPIALLLTTQSVVAMPSFIETHLRKDTGALRKGICSNILLNLLVSAACVTLLVLTGRWLVHFLFGPSNLPPEILDRIYSVLTAAGGIILTAGSLALLQSAFIAIKRLRFLSGTLWAGLLVKLCLALVVVRWNDPAYWLTFVSSTMSVLMTIFLIVAIYRMLSSVPSQNPIT